MKMKFMDMTGIWMNKTAGSLKGGFVGCFQVLHENMGG